MSLTTLDLPVRSLFNRIAEPAAASVPDMIAVGAALAHLAADTDYFARWIELIRDTSGSVAIHAPARGPRLMLVHRREGEMGAVHDHGTWVALAPIVGLETHRRYRVIGESSAARPEVVETLGLRPSEPVTLTPPDDLHDHGHLAGHGTPAYILILTGDDQTMFVRTEWDLATGRHRTLEPGVVGRWLAR